MKQKIGFLAAALLALLIITLTSANSFGQSPRRQFVADTGIMTPGSSQKLRVTVTSASDTQAIRVRFRRCLFSELGGAYTLESTLISSILPIPSNEARFFDTFGTGAAMRLRIGSPTPNIVVTFQLIDTSTGEIEWASEAVIKEQDVWAAAN